MDTLMDQYRFPNASYIDIHMFDRLFSSSGNNTSDSTDAGARSLREQMVEEQIKKRGISDERILEAMRQIPRHKFVPEADLERAYDDRPHPIGCNQTISQPYIVALMTSSLDLNEDHSVLEIGTGSGYQAAILAYIADQVYTVERHQQLADQAKEVLYELGYENVMIRVGDGTKGWPEKQPFDRIIVTAGGPDVPDSLVDQLRDSGGKMVIPVGERRSQRLTRLTKQGGDVKREELGSCVFVQLVGEEGW
jgi:protein-L-isoaspartate(D-aspartate) O-methyltransferase